MMSLYNSEEREIVVRKTVFEVFEIKNRVLALLKTMEETDDQIREAFREINGSSFHSFDPLHCAPRGYSGGDKLEKAVDQRCWQYVVGLYNLEKFMLCTDYEKMVSQIEQCDMPPFTVENAESWILSLKALIHESVQKLVEDVFERITEATYQTGGWNSPKKKRNNNGIDKFFIVHTNDVSSLNWHQRNPTITDDLEKACYIIDGKRSPDVTLKCSLRDSKRVTGENEYFKITICANGNTHYRWKRDDIRDRLNLYGSKRGVIGEDVKIKIFGKDGAK